ncbi:phosphonate ABC transporter ATP-binding protein [Litorivicinus sp.]|nr:phosphonate ABC transporter ATP-binding protein [Litorivicinus sp.]
MIRFDNVSKSYPDGTVALNGLTFDVPKGQFCVLLGHSGAGKSTILRLVNGLVSASDGDIIVDDEKITPKSLQSVRRKVAMIHQEFNLSSRSTVATNVMTGALVDVSAIRALIGWFPAAIRKKCCDLVAMVGLKEEHLTRRASALSGGQQQRVGIARSLMLDPLVILADEPIASLDPSASRDVLSHLRSITRRNDCTVLCCLHQVEFAREYADRIVGIEGGKVVFDLLPDQVNDQTLNLIYKNYDDPDGSLAVKEVAINNVVDKIGKH